MESTGAPRPAAKRKDVFDNPESKLRYEAYRCDYLRFEAFRCVTTRECLTHTAGSV